MNRHILNTLVVWLGLSLLACTSTGIITPDPQANQDQVATAVAATLTAQVPSSLTPTGEVAETGATPTGGAVGETLPTLTPVPGATDTAAAPQAADTPAGPSCRVVSQGLNIRSGPGLVYHPPVASVARDTELTPIAYNPSGFPGQWLQVLVEGTGQIGWVSADAQFVSCNIADLNSLPFVAGPPTPTPTSTPTPPPTPVPTNTPTPTPPTFFVLVPGGGGNNQIRGQVLFPGFRPGELNPDDLVFRDHFAFRVETYDITTGSTRDGAGIEFVQMQISGDNGEVYRRTEMSAPYCLFGGDDPECRPWPRFAEFDYTWPNGEPIENNVPYNVRIDIQPARGGSANWNFSFRVAGAPGPPADPVAEIVQIGPGSTETVVRDALVFQVRAYDPDEGDDDGDGIDEVEMRLRRGNQVIFENTEGNAAYCLFQGGEPDCNVWIFADQGHHWPNGDPITEGEYVLEAVIRAESGRELRIEQVVQVAP